MKGTKKSTVRMNGLCFFAKTASDFESQVAALIRYP